MLVRIAAATRGADAALGALEDALAAMPEAPALLRLREEITAR